MSATPAMTTWSGMHGVYGRIMLAIATAPAADPLTLASAKSYLRVDHSADDSYITDELIPEARSWAERYMSRALIRQDWDMRLDRFPTTSDLPNAEILTPFGKCTAVLYIKYIDVDGVEQELNGPTSTVPATDYEELLTDDDGARIRPPSGESWPSTSTVMGAVTVRFRAGYGSSAASIPKAIISGIKFKMADLYEVRGSLDARYASKSDNWLAAERLLDPFVLRSF